MAVVVAAAIPVPRQGGGVGLAFAGIEGAAARVEFKDGQGAGAELDVAAVVDMIGRHGIPGVHAMWRAGEGVTPAEVGKAREVVVGGTYPSGETIWRMER